MRDFLIKIGTFFGTLLGISLVIAIPCWLSEPVMKVHHQITSSSKYQDMVLAFSSAETITETYANGQRSRQYCVKKNFRGDLVEHGNAEGWYENGRKMWEGTFNNGKLVKLKMWDKNGILKTLPELLGRKK